MIIIFLPRFNVTVGSMLIRDAVTDSFYINGAVPPSGKLMPSRAIERTVKGKNFIFSVSDSISVSPDNEEIAARRFANIIKDSHDHILSAGKARLKGILEEFTTFANGKMRSVSPDGSYGSSFALLCVNNGVATMVNAGDVQGFSFRDNILVPLTRTHAAKKVYAGISDERVLVGKPEKYVGSAFGGDSIRPYFSEPVPVDVDDVFLICSNGLTDVISNERIEYILSLDIPDERMVHRLISEAVAGGAEDNITVMLIRNGGKPIKSNKTVKRIVGLIALVIILAVITAFIASLFRRPEMPVIHEEPPETIETEDNDFATHESSAVPPDDEFILRGVYPNN